MGEIEEIKEIKEKFLGFFKNAHKKNWIIYSILIFIIWLSAFIRTRNMVYLKGKYLLAYDPYVFYRYAEYIVEHGKLMAIDTMRYVPLGINTARETTLISYVIAYMYKFFNMFIPMTLMQFDIIYPVIFFSLSLIIFFLLVKELFDKRIAILATAFLAVIPVFLYRTMAGFSEKEPIGIFFMFLTFYLWIKSINQTKLKNKLIFASLSGISTGLLGLVWGGVGFVLVIIPTFVFVEFLLNKLKKEDTFAYFLWLIFFLTLLQFSQKYTFLVLAAYFSTGLCFLIAFVLVINLLLSTKYFDKLKEKVNLPHNILSFILAILVFLLIIFLFFGPDVVFHNIASIKNELLNPMGTSRFVSTVAEAKQPYVIQWIEQFNLFFYLFIIGSIVLFYELIKPIKTYRIKRIIKKIIKLSDENSEINETPRELNPPLIFLEQKKEFEEEVGESTTQIKKYRYYLVTIYSLFILILLYSRYSPNSILNGENFLSIFLYFSSLVIFITFLFILYLYFYYKNKKIYDSLSKLSNNYVFLFIWFFLMIVAARGAFRLIMLLAPICVILVSYLIFKIVDYGIINKKNIYKLICFALVIIIILVPVKGSLVYFLKVSYDLSKYGTPPSFNDQWQEAMEWVQENTPEDAVFAHWWDYGYWVQAMGNRATITDGGNMIGPWNHYMGRHVLTGENPTEALEFLKTHNASYLMIYSQEVGKYEAFSMLGSDVNYDRLSHISVFYNHPQNIQEIRNGTTYLYSGRFMLDEDIIYQNKLFPKVSASIDGVIITLGESNGTIQINQPTAILFYNGQQTEVPLGCVYYNGQEYNFNEEGLKGCFQIVSSIENNEAIFGRAALYLSEKVRNTLFAQMFLFDKEWLGFKKVYDDSETGFRIALVKGANNMVGPIKIWKINYPPNIKIKPQYLETTYPEGVPD